MYVSSKYILYGRFIQKHSSKLLTNYHKMLTSKSKISDITAVLAIKLLNFDSDTDQVICLRFTENLNFFVLFFSLIFMLTFDEPLRKQEIFIFSLF